MTDSINFEGQKILNTSISRDEFIAKFQDETFKANAGSIFDKFDTNQNQTLDKHEQLAFMKFMKSLAGDDTEITSQEYWNKSNKAFDKGFMGMESLNQTYEAFKSIVEDNAENSVDVVYTEHDAKLNRETYDKVHLTDAWRDKRDTADKIVAGQNGYGAIKTLTTAEAVLDKLIELNGLEVTDEQKPELLKRLIKFNPSVFNRETGEVWNEANWSKLDFPSGTEISSMIDDGAEIEESIGQANKPASSDNTSTTPTFSWQTFSTTNNNQTFMPNLAQSDYSLTDINGNSFYIKYDTEGKPTAKIQGENVEFSMEQDSPLIYNNTYYAKVTINGKQYVESGTTYDLAFTNLKQKVQPSPLSFNWTTPTGK